MAGGPLLTGSDRSESMVIHVVDVATDTGQVWPQSNRPQPTRAGPDLGQGLLPVTLCGMGP